MKIKITLVADEGMLLTDGKSYGRTVHLARSEDAALWREIPESEYREEAME